MAALMHPRYELEELEAFEEIEIGRAPARPRLALVGEPRAAVRCSPPTTRATFWRRRIVAVAVALAVVVALGKAGDVLGGAPLATPERPPASSYVVQPGDSLWSVARHLAPDADPRPIVDALAQDRGDTTLLPGETIEWRG